MADLRVRRGYPAVASMRLGLLQRVLMSFSFSSPRRTAIATACLSTIHFLGLGLFSPSTAWAQSTAESASVSTPPAAPDLGEVIVSADKSASSLRAAPSAIDKINRATLAEKKPTFVGQVLNQSAGVYVTDLGNEQHNMSIRQPLSYNAVYLYMEDGIPIRPMGLFNHNSLYEINLAGTEDIEVMKGPASALYGSNAVGGAINFLTRAASAQPQGALGMQASDQGYRRVDYTASTPVGEGGDRKSVV